VLVILSPKLHWRIGVVTDHSLPIFKKNALLPTLATSMTWQALSNFTAADEARLHFIFQPNGSLVSCDDVGGTLNSLCAPWHLHVYRIRGLNMRFVVIFITNYFHLARNGSGVIWYISENM
jgi:hypothetical protein